MLILTALIFIANIIISTDVARWLGVKRLSFAMTMSFGILICGYNLLFNLLGIFHQINFTNVFAFEILLIGTFFYKRFDHLKRIVIDFVSLIKENKLYYLIILPLLILLTLSAFLLPPNNNDSMCYHLARVVHWIQNGDLSYYFTSIDRQNRMGPGAELLILLLQLLSTSDRLAVCVQLISFLFICISLPDILRLLGVAKKNITYICIFTISTPMLLFEAVTTQNDVVASLNTIAIVLLMFKLYKTRSQYISYKFFVLIGVTFASAYLVKPTSILLLIPLIFFIGGYILLKNHFKHYILKISVALLVFMFISTPDVYRKVTASQDQNTSFNDVLYPLTKEWNSSRFFNVFLAGMHHSPHNYTENEALIKNGASLLNAKYDETAIKNNWNFIPHEDYIGSPLQFMAFFALCIFNLFALFVSRFKTKYLLSFLPLFSFLVLGLFIKDNPWLSRIQLPFFILIPLCFIPIENCGGLMFQRLYGVGIRAVAFVALSIGILAFSQNAIRPLKMESIFTETDPLEVYYYDNKALKADHDMIMRLCDGNEIKTVGVIAGPSFLEYPLGWGLHKKGILLKHIRKENLQNLDLIYLQKPLDLKFNPRVYVKLNDKMYLLRKPIKTLLDSGFYDIPLASLFLEGGGSVLKSKSVFFYGDGTITSPKIKFTKGNYIILIKSNGALVDGIGSHWNINFGYNKVGEISSICNSQIDSVRFSISSSGEYELRMQFDNDIWDPVRNLDRNGEIENITIFKK